MRNLLKADLYKISKSLSLKILFLLMVALSLITALSVRSYEGNPLAEEYEIIFKGGEAYYSSLTDAPILVSLAIFVIAILICNDFSNHYIQTAISSGYGRKEILLSKFISVSFTFFIVLLPYPLVRTLVQSMLYGFGQPVNAQVLIKLFFDYFLMVLVVLAISGIVFILAYRLKWTVLVIGISFLLLVLGNSIFQSIALVNRSFMNIWVKTPFGLIFFLKTNMFSPHSALIAFVISMITIILALLISFYFFNKDESF